MSTMGADFLPYTVFARKLFGMGADTAREIQRNYEEDGSTNV